MTAVPGAARRTCPRCAAEVLQQLVGHRAALLAVADPQVRPLAELEPHTGPNRLAWCAVPLRGGGIDLRWHSRRRDCGAGHVIDHQCPPASPWGRTPQGGLW